MFVALAHDVSIAVSRREAQPYPNREISDIEKRERDRDL